jgi:hypothetical protein
MPMLEKENYLIHYNIYDNEFDITSVEVFAEAETKPNKKEFLWVWADTMPNDLRDFVYDQAAKILERDL